MTKRQMEARETWQKYQNLAAGFAASVRGTQIKILVGNPPVVHEVPADDLLAAGRIVWDQALGPLITLDRDFPLQGSGKLSKRVYDNYPAYPVRK